MFQSHIWFWGLLLNKISFNKQMKLKQTISMTITLSWRFLYIFWESGLLCGGQSRDGGVFEMAAAWLTGGDKANSTENFPTSLLASPPLWKRYIKVFWHDRYELKTKVKPKKTILSQTESNLSLFLLSILVPYTYYEQDISFLIQLWDKSYRVNFRWFLLCC